MADDTADQLHALAIHLLRWARRDDELTGLSAPRLSVLSVLVFGGARTVTELAAAEQVAAPTMTRLLQGLEAAGYVTRRRDTGDARVVRVRATARGRQVLQAGRRNRLRRVAAVLSEVPAAERRHIAGAVRALRAALMRAAAR
ncbi:MAG TPA: MarR family transcriptional regulator [Longimicrobiales bacterium]|nr:MarR family transcriptional regulator [Longimicrobiales bacterium]